mmetsp:Transcript_6406/g.12304  ORF Transcript_6406/g.12304 Transcript_6406/m.12304 type:complete len:493 (+) Transcript_6406:47-1525(+)
MGNSEKTTWDIVSKYLKYAFSSAMTVTYLIYIMWGIWTHQAVLPGHFVFHFIVFLFCLTLVAYLEGLQVAILNCEHVDPEKRKESHPRAYKLMTSVRQGNNVERFLVGRQFFTIFVMTLMAQVTSFPDISHLGVPDVVWFIFISTGLPGAMVVTTIGSLQPQLLAAKDPWNFLDLYGSNSVLNLCYGLEWTGICTHFAWMLIGILRKTVFRSDIPTKDKKSEMNTQERAIDYLKYFVSFCVLGMYFTYLMYGIWTGEALLSQSGVPGVVVFIVFSCCILFLALLEGLQVGILVRENKDPEENNYPETHPRATALMKRATHEKNVRRFLIGRQFFVIFVVFLINQCTIFPDIQQFGVNPALWFVVIQLGLPTALNVLCFGQLPAQLLANHDPMLFMNRPGPRFTLEVCLFTEMTGIAHFSWVATAISMFTWFKVSPTALDDLATFKDLEAVKDGKGKENSQTEDVTSAGGQTDGGYNKVSGLELDVANGKQEV